jgi:hypothetical protein
MMPSAEPLSVSFGALIRVRVEADLPAAIRAAARRRRMKQSEFIRQALRDALARDGVQLGDDTPAESR